jgi:hypothetical protein
MVVSVHDATLSAGRPSYTTARDANGQELLPGDRDGAK